MTPEQREELKAAAQEKIRAKTESVKDYFTISQAFDDLANPEAILSLIAQVEALTVPQGCPMSTAPHDGTEVLAWSKTGKTWHQVYWKTQENGDWLFLPPFPPRWACRWNEAYYQGQAEFSHWTPIPSDPTIPAIPGTKEGA